jgi:hypothetical protein
MEANIFDCPMVFKTMRMIKNAKIQIHFKCIIYAKNLHSTLQEPLEDMKILQPENEIKSYVKKYDKPTNITKMMEENSYKFQHVACGHLTKNPSFEKI